MATHEIGHYLNLRHIWGDERCGDDMVDDTHEHVTDNFGCPTEPHNVDSCVSAIENPRGEMYMNYMDYCFEIGALTPSLQEKFITESKDILKESQLIRYVENKPCREQRK